MLMIHILMFCFFPLTVWFLCSKPSFIWVNTAEWWQKQKHNMPEPKYNVSRHWNTRWKQKWQVPFRVQRLGESKVSAAIFPPASSIWGWLGQQSLLDTEPSVRELQHATGLSESHRARFHMFPIIVKQKIEKIVSETSELPILWSWTMAESGRQCLGVMVKHAVWSPHIVAPQHQKKQTP